MRVVCWGTYDLGKPRNRILLRGLREAGVELVEIHADVWGGVEDKGHVRGPLRKLLLLLKWLSAYPGLIWRYMRAPKHDTVLIGYMGHLDVLLIWPFAKLRGAPVVWDVFLSLYNTVVEDRRMVGRGNPLVWLLYAWEWLACRAARRLVMDTRAHADYLAGRYGLAPDRVASVFVGVEPEAFPPMPAKPRDDDELRVLFYGQFIPLHGIETIVRAAQLAAAEPIRWVLIGRGQEEERVRHLLAQAPARVEWIEWVDYDRLQDEIARADVCLGIFGDTDKAARVIPNKVFQIISCGAPLITRDSPAIRELLSPEMESVWLVPAGNAEALLGAVREVGEGPDSCESSYRTELSAQIMPAAIGANLCAIIDAACGGQVR